MKIRGFCVKQYLISFPNGYESGQIHFLSVFRCLSTKSVSNRNSHEKKKLDMGNINGLSDAFRLYESMARMRPLPCKKQFTQSLSRVVNLNEYSAAICIFKHMCNLGTPVNEFTMNIAINSCCLSNRINFGFSILASFFKSRCVPDAVTFGTLLKGLFRQNKIIEAQELFRKIIREGICNLNVVMYGTVIAGLCKVGNTKVAIELPRVMEKGNCKPNCYIYTMIIDVLCKDKMIDSALKLFDEMSEKGITPDVVTYTALICGLCKLSRWREVKMLLKEMIDCHLHPDVITFNSIIDPFCKEGFVDEAEVVLHIMKQKIVAPNIVTYIILMNGYCLQGRVDETRDIFDSMANKNIVPRVHCNILINGYCKTMQIDDAVHLFDELPRKGFNPNLIAYTSMIL